MTWDPIALEQIDSQSTVHKTRQAGQLAAECWNSATFFDLSPAQKLRYVAKKWLEQVRFTQRLRHSKISLNTRRVLYSLGSQPSQQYTLLSWTSVIEIIQFNTNCGHLIPFYIPQQMPDFEALSVQSIPFLSPHEISGSMTIRHIPNIFNYRMHHFSYLWLVIWQLHVFVYWTRWDRIWTEQYLEKAKMERQNVFLELLSL